MYVIIWFWITHSDNEGCDTDTTDHSHSTSKKGAQKQQCQFIQLEDFAADNESNDEVPLSNMIYEENKCKTPSGI